MSLSTQTSPPTAARGKLTRRQVMAAALACVDRDGLEALSMHKLGDALGVKAMSLYNHVANKDDVLGGIVDVLWSEVAPPPSEPASWHDVARTLAGSLRDMIHRHPSAAPLLLSARPISEHALLVADAFRAALTAAGLPDECAVPFLRTVVSYGLGQSLAVLAWSGETCDDVDELARIRRVGNLLPHGASDDLLRVALWFCDDCVSAEQYDLGLTLMIKGLDAYLAE